MANIKYKMNTNTAGEKVITEIKKVKRVSFLCYEKSSKKMYTFTYDFIAEVATEQTGRFKTLLKEKGYKIVDVTKENATTEKSVKLADLFALYEQAEQAEQTEQSEQSEQTEQTEQTENS